MQVTFADKGSLKHSFLMPRKRNFSLFGLEMQFLRASDLCFAKLLVLQNARKKGFTKNSEFSLRFKNKLSVAF